MALEQMWIHVFLEVVAILFGIWTIYNINKLEKLWEKISITFIMSAIITIDVIVLLSWSNILELSNKIGFHKFTEFLALPAGLITMIIASQQEDKSIRYPLFIFGLASVIIDFYLFTTW